MGFVRSNRSHNTGIGKTFEDLLGTLENNKKEADFEGIEVKSQRQAAASCITLFTKSPTFPKAVNSILRDKYGTVVDPQNPIIKKLHTSMFGNRFNTYKGVYGFQLKVDKDKREVLIVVKDLKTDLILSSDIGWSFAELEQASNKINTLFVVWADKKMVDGIEYFHYTKAKIHHNFILEKFITAIEEGGIMVDIRIGTYKSGPSEGKPHDHGTGFRVKKEFLKNLYEECEEVE